MTMAVRILLTLASAFVGLALAENEKPSLTPFIVGGSPTKRGEFPWIVWFITPTYSCGGTIINKDWILTAAHCISEDESEAGYRVTVGDYDKSTREGSEQTVGVANIIVHEDYDGNPQNGNDIALIQLSSSLSFNTYVQPGQLADSSTKSEKDLVVAGWGRTREGGSGSRTLLKVTVPLLEATKCQKVYPYHPQSQLCAGIEGKDSCQGDSGGPLQNKNDKVVVGIVSWGDGCGRRNKPGVYTAVAYFSDWIQNYVSE